jgi:Bacterial Ig-like domain (group 3)/Fibronectin type III domain
LRTTRASLVLYGAVGAVVVSLASTAYASSAPPSAVRRPGTGLSTNYDFTRLVLADGGWPQSSNNVTVLTQWLRAEEPVTHWWNRANPLNNGLGSGGGSGLGSYRTVVAAAYFVARNLKRDAYGYPLVAHDLSISAPSSATARAIWRSHWAAGHYGWGAGWSMTPVEAVSAPPTAWQSATACPIKYPLHVLGPCGSGFATTGAGWHAGAPIGYRREELWTFVGKQSSPTTARWVPALAAGNYQVAAFVPARFADGDATYVVTDARGAHRLRVDQEPFANTWVTFGVFTSSPTAPLRVQVTPSRRGSAGSTYVAADAMRFVPTKSPAAVTVGTSNGVARHLTRLPGRPEHVAAIAGDASAQVTWLAPSKDGGARVLDYRVTTSPGGHGCAAKVLTSGLWSCSIQGLHNGTTYTFTVRALNRLGKGAPSLPSSPVRPLAAAALRLTVAQPRLWFGERVIVRAVVSPHVRLAPHDKGGTVLFFEDGKPISGCGEARVVHGRAACSWRLGSPGTHVLLASFSGSSTLSGAGQSLAMVVKRVATKFLTSATPVVVAPGDTETYRLWQLPGLATGKVVFSSGTTRLCVATVADGGGTCAAKVTLGTGVHVVTAHYAGDRNFASSTSRTSLQVLAAPPPT